MSDITYCFDVILPVYRQGDDMQESLDQTSSVAEAFELQASRYAEAAKTCELLAKLAKDTPTIEVIGAENHWISISGPLSKLSALVQENRVRKLSDDDSIEDFFDASK